MLCSRGGSIFLPLGTHRLLTRDDHDYDADDGDDDDAAAAAAAGCGDGCESGTMVMRMMVTMCVDGSDGISSYELASCCADNVWFSLLIMRP